jgi:hypothetical protein
VIALLDANVLIAMVVAEHVHHESADAWIDSWEGEFATCPITEGSLVRLLVREGAPAAQATEVVREVHAHNLHRYWPADVSYSDLPTRGVIGYRQVTDAYLVELARQHDGVVATFDWGLAQLHGELAVRVPVA